ncbi:hypothetical protein LTR56_022121 [Elasticomyces elasticus]|nr:hypothetical protein LTR56_022121 [Elasticomyces elasticus]KAK3642011.1 hypothetical protein LTR22_016336 [Elasticomyces elasticus]KAK4910638.1 hypothetical protein LTR49_020673 [Elasticomyces elasticus]KAK5748855.1 hypothetical protein LTS12_021093 [Elasticomyces elasticus]
MEALTKALQSDKLMKLVIGEGEKSVTFYVSRTTLEHTSDYFCAAIRNSHLGGGDVDTITFPEDNLQAWKVLLHWMITHELPKAAELLLQNFEFEDEEHEEDEKDEKDEKDETSTDTDHKLCIRCWALGDMYDIPDFQDLIMLELLRSLELEPIQLDEIKEGIECTGPGSKLRDLMAEELAREVSAGDIETSELDAFDGVSGFSNILVAKMNRLAEWKQLNPLNPFVEFTPRVPLGLERSREGGSPYRNFMVDGERPAQHWLQRDLEELRVNQKGGYGNWH